MRLAARTRAPCGDTGASAVEFALLMPIFIMLTFGTLTGGIAFWHHIELTQGARDAARLGATFPITTLPTAPPGEKTMPEWLAMVADVAANESGWGGVADVAPSDSGGFICVAYVAGEGDLLSTERQIIGTPRASDGLTASSTVAAPCFNDGLTDSRVQVLVRRDSELNAVLYSSDLELRTHSSIPYERRDPL